MSSAPQNPTLFQQGSNRNLPPLADRMRPTTLDDFVGHESLVGKDHLIGKAMAIGQLFSMIFWGPPGSGKTTLARLIAHHAEAEMHEISAVSSGVKDVREVLRQAGNNREIGRQTILFIDEIHRFNKSQQDALLHAVEDGTIILIGATTENPSFEVISALQSRCRVIVLRSYEGGELETMLDRAMNEDILLSQRQITIAADVRDLLIESAGGDARKMYNALDIAVGRYGSESSFTITMEDVQEALQQRGLLYDRAGDYHYDTISAFIKSVRGSDPDASLYWLAIMLEGGEKPEFIARRLIILASEDIGNADPNALVMATAAMQSVHFVGMPESAIILGQVTSYLASTTKSNASYKAVKSAIEVVKKTGAQSVPLHLRNAATGLMKKLDYGKGYDYPHSHAEHFVEADYFPAETGKMKFYEPTTQGQEAFLRKRLEKLWPGRY